MNILIIGGTGILSTSVVDECLKKRYNITMLNRGRRKAFINPNVELIKCDVNNKDQVNSLLSGRNFDVVVDFLCYNESQVINSIDLFGPKVRQYVFISSAQVYNTSIDQVFFEDADKPQKLWSYSINKFKAENKVIELCGKFGIHYTIVRPGVNYDNTRIPYGIYPPIGQHWTLCNRILKDKPIITWNNGSNKLNLTRSEDFARGVSGLLGNEKAYDESFNVVGDNVYTWLEVLTILGKLLGHKVTTIDIPVDFYAENLSNDGESLRGGRANNLVCSNEKLKKVCPDFYTEYDLELGLKKTLEYYEENNYLSGYSSEFDGETDRIINKYLYLSNKSKIKLSFSPFGDKSMRLLTKEFVKYSLARYNDNRIIKLLWSLKR